MGFIGRKSVGCCKGKGLICLKRKNMGKADAKIADVAEWSTHKDNGVLTAVITIHTEGNGLQK